MGAALHFDLNFLLLRAAARWHGMVSLPRLKLPQRHGYSLPLQLVTAHI